METNDVVTIVRTELSGEGALFKTRHVGKTDIVTGVPNSRNRAGGYAGSLQLRNREPTECRKDALRLGFFLNAHGTVSLMQLVESCCARFLTTPFPDTSLAGDPLDGAIERPAFGASLTRRAARALFRHGKMAAH